MTNAEKIDFSMTSYLPVDLPDDGGTAMFVTCMLRDISASYGVAFRGYELLRLLGVREFNRFADKVMYDEDGALRLAVLLERLAVSYPHQAPCANVYAQTIRSAICKAKAEALMSKLVFATNAERQSALLDGLFASMTAPGHEEEAADDESRDIECQDFSDATIATLATSYAGKVTLATAEVAQILGREEQTLRLWASRQTGPIQPKKVGGRLLWLTEDVQRLLK